MGKVQNERTMDKGEEKREKGEGIEKDTRILTFKASIFNIIASNQPKFLFFIYAISTAVCHSTSSGISILPDRYATAQTDCIADTNPVATLGA